MLHRPAVWLLLAATSLPATPLLAQDATVTQPPPTDVVVPPPPVSQPTVTQPVVTQPVTTAPSTPPTSARTPTPVTEAPAAPARRTATRTPRTTTTRAATPARTAAPARTSAPAPAAAAPAAAPTAAPAAPAAETATPIPAALPVPQEQPAETGTGPGIWTWVVLGGLLLLGAFALLQMRRHRRRTEDEVYHDEAPVMAEPVNERRVDPMPKVVPAMGFAAADEDPRQYERSSFAEADATLAAAALHERAAEAEEDRVPVAEEPVAVAEEIAVADADPADVEALAAASAAPDGRPWLEFLMRPVRAGTSKDATVVEFELTVGNTGDAPARDVRISTFMFAAGSAGESEMERMLIDPPADAALARVEIDPGDATKVEASMALPREGLVEGSVLPVVVADARYRLPDGREGRTRASFEVGIPSESGLDPFPTDRTSGLLESVDARLHDEPERV